MLSRSNYGQLAGVLLLTLMFDARADAPAACDVSKDFTTPELRAQCDAAIAQEKEPRNRAQLLHRRAYVAVEQYRYEDAMTDLNLALTADPDCANCLHERAYVNSELGEYGAAIADLDRELVIRPESASAYSERAFARRYNGDLEGAYLDRKRELELEPQSTDALQARAEAAMWLGRFDEADADFSKAEAQAKAAGDEKARASAVRKREDISLWRASSSNKKAAGHCVMQALGAHDPKVKALIADCTVAFFAAKDGPAKAEALTTRSTAWTLLDSSWERCTEDRRIAVGFDPTNPERHINLGYAYTSMEHSRAALWEFNRALALKRSWMALAGRAQALARTGDPDGAFADARASFEMQSNEPALWVLADLAYDKGDRDVARKFYIGVYQFGSRDDRLIERLKELGVDDPDKAAKDAQ